MTLNRSSHNGPPAPTEHVAGPARRLRRQPRRTALARSCWRCRRRRGAATLDGRRHRSAPRNVSYGSATLSGSVNPERERHLLLLPVRPDPRSTAARARSARPARAQRPCQRRGRHRRPAAAHRLPLPAGRGQRRRRPRSATTTPSRRRRCRCRCDPRLPTRCLRRPVTVQGTLSGTGNAGRAGGRAGAAVPVHGAASSTSATPS